MKKTDKITISQRRLPRISCFLKYLERCERQLLISEVSEIFAMHYKGFGILPLVVTLSFPVVVCLREI